MAIANARNQYLKTQIETASKEQLVVMLFDGIIRFTEQARKAMNDKDIEGSHHALMRAQAIIMELICTVDKEKGGDVATNLMSLHAYAFNCLIVCNMRKETEKIDEVQKIYRELREAWVGAMDTLGIGAQGSKSAPTAAPQAPATANQQPASPLPGSGVTAKAASKPNQPTTTFVAGSTHIAAPATPPPAAAPKTGGYGIGRTAALAPAPSAPAAPQANAPAVNAVPTPSAPAPAPKAPAAPVSAKHNAMLNAYGATKRSIA